MNEALNLELEFSYPTPICKNELSISPSLETEFSLGGIFSINNSGVIEPTNGTIDLVNSESGIYQVTYTYNGNENCFLAGENTSSTTIELIDLPDAAFTFEQNSGYTVEFSNASLNVDEFFWDFGNGDTSSQQNPSFIFPFDGLYPIRLILTNECGSDTLDATIDVLKLSAENLNISSIKMFPNPAKNQLTLLYDDSELHNVLVNIFDLSGRLIFNEEFKGNLLKMIDVSNFHNGVYWIEVKAQKKRFLHKFFVVN